MIKKLRQELDWSVNQLADYIEVNERTVRRWEAGDIPEPLAVTLLLQYVLKYG